MTNLNTSYQVRGAKEQADPSLPAPTIPVADPEDGLIRTEDLNEDVLLEFPLWPRAQLNDHYFFILNGEEGPENSLIEFPPVGTNLTLKLPLTLLDQDGPYVVEYGVKPFPSGADSRSYPKTILIDRTPPGAHQLGYMDFPDVAKDGLTLDELSDMGDVLVGSIFGYSDLKRGDVIQTYWGSVTGPSVTLDGMEDGTAPIEVRFSKAFLTSLPSPAGATWYKVTDRAGNVSEDSRKVTIPLFLTEVTPGLPKPVVDDSDGLINYQEARVGVEVKIPSSSFLEAGDQITLYWATEKMGPVPVDPDDLSEPFVLFFTVMFDTIEAAGNGLRQLKYEVIRGGQVVGVSNDLELEVNIELPVPGTPEKPTVRGGSGTPSNEDNFIDENDFELNATVIINWNSGFKASQVLRIFWGGQEVLDQPYIITNSDVVAGRPLLLTALNSKFKPVGTGSDIRVYYTVNTPGNPNTSTSLEQGIIVRSKDELPGGPDGPDAPEFTDLNEYGAINPINGAAGAPVYIKPYINIAAGQVIVFTYEAFDQLVGGTKLFEWTHTSADLTEEEVTNGYNFLVPRSILDRHFYGHVEATFQVRSDTGQGNSKRASVWIDMRGGKR
ncbi:hypothetical protein TRP66_19320 [Pseudomonas sp. JDS28PS106]|uniref:hypothetical protein n=1 Tax=Pseudomonas sp. JDS28PS106 TaxID=2497235 RepID=UPI002FD47199